MGVGPGTVSEHKGTLLSPREFGLPPKFSAWRDNQENMICEFLDAPYAYVAQCAPTGSGKSVTAVACAELSGGRSVILTSTKALQAQYLCVAPYTKLCTGDLRWVAADTIKTGDVLLGFDEHRAGNRRMWKPSVVENVAVLKKPCYRLVLGDGTQVVSSADHKWLVRGKGRQAPWWLATSALRQKGLRYPPHYLLRVLDTWERREDLDTGYLAAAFDGEGSLSQAHAYHKHTPNGIAVSLSFAQVENQMLEFVKKALARKNLPFTCSTYHKDACVRLEVSGRRNIMRFLGEIRPLRLLPKLRLDLLGMMNPATALPIVEKEFIGIQEVCSIQTSTHTYVAEGLASHNCDFAELGVVEIKGKNAYRCREDGYGRGCDYGDCNFGLNCAYMSGGCGYYDALRAAREARTVVTNYAYWLTTNFYGEGLYPKSQAELLVLDEAHHADQHVVSLLTFHIRKRDVEAVLNMTVPASLSHVGRWAKQAHAKADQDYQHMLYALKEGHKVSRDEMHKLKTLRTKLEFAMRHAGDKDWMMELHDGLKLCPVWPKAHARKVLFAGSKRVLMLSATVRPKTVEMLGLVPEMGRGDAGVKGEVLRAQVEGAVSEVGKGDCLFSDYPSIFSADRRPVIHIPTVRMNHHTTKEELGVWMRRIDQIISPRLHQKGIIHTVSYDRRDYVMEHSEHAGVMMTHQSGNVIEVVERFKKSPAPCVLVSPSVTTGFDFVGDLARWQIIGKIPFPDTRDRLMKARMAKDPEYGAYLAMQSLVQASGRICRGPSDYGVSFLIDDSAFWFMKRYRHFAPRWFMDGYRTSHLIPQG